MRGATTLIEELERAANRADLEATRLQTIADRGGAAAMVQAADSKMEAARLRARAAWARELERQTKTPGANTKMIEALQMLWGSEVPAPEPEPIRTTDGALFLRFKDEETRQQFLADMEALAERAKRPWDGSDGGHRYDTRGTSDCSFGCGCWAGPSRSGGPDGIDPFGNCPKNPSPWSRG